MKIKLKNNGSIVTAKQKLAVRVDWGNDRAAVPCFFLLGAIRLCGQAGLSIVVKMSKDFKNWIKAEKAELGFTDRKLLARMYRRIKREEVTRTRPSTKQSQSGLSNRDANRRF